MTRQGRLPVYPNEVKIRFMTDAIVVLCTCPDQTSADLLCEQLLNQRLAACINIVPGARSIYRWNGRVHTGDEVVLIIKTTDARLAGLTRRLQALHPFDVPELVALPVSGGLLAYLAWLDAATADDAADLAPPASAE